jgi:toxin ParE1/3/4
VTYRILIQPPAFDDLELARRWIARHSAERADLWLQGIFEAIQTLTSFPRRCPLAPESDLFADQIRQLLHGDYRVLFMVEDHQVRILHVRHGARRTMTTDDME